MNGNGDAYQSWNNDQEIAMKAINFKFQGFNFFLAVASSSNFSIISEVLMSSSVFMILKLKRPRNIIPGP